MILPLLFTLSVPAEEAYSEPANACEVSWATEVSQRFIDGTKQRIDRRCRELVGALDYDVEPGSIRIEIGGETYAFTVRVDLLDDGEVVYRQEDDGDVCECGGNDLAALAMQRVVSAVNAHRDPASEPVVPKPQGPPEQSPKPAEPKHTLRWIGVGVGVLGLGVGVTGGVLMPRETNERRLGGGNTGSEITRRHPLPLTASMIGIGAVGVVAGITMIAIDAKRSKSAKRTTFSPTVGTQHVGFTLTGKF